MRLEAGKFRTCPVAPNPPPPDLTPGEHKAPQHENDHEHQRAAGIGHHNVSGNGSNGSENADGQVMHQEQQQPTHEEPAHVKPHHVMRVTRKSSETKGDDGC